jgi:hypothetical protein
LTSNFVPAFSQAAIIASASSSEVAIAFSQRMPLTPASAAAMTICAFMSVWVQTLTMSKPSLANISRKSV